MIFRPQQGDYLYDNTCTTDAVVGQIFLHFCGSQVLRSLILLN